MIETNSLGAYILHIMDLSLKHDSGHRRGATLVGHLRSGCPWMTPFWHGTYPRAPCATRVTWQLLTWWAGGHPTWSLWSSAVNYGVRYFLTSLNMNCAQHTAFYANDELMSNWKRDRKGLFAILSSSLWVTFEAKSLNESWCQIQ